MTELAIINPVEFGLNENQGKEIEEQFLPVISERENLVESYTSILSKQITPQVEKEAKELRMKLVKVRSNTDQIHKAAKAFYLAGGRFVDAWKNKNNTTIEQMESALKEIETTSERAETARIKAIEQSRIDELSQFSNVLPNNLGYMADDIYQNYLVGIKIAYEAKIAAEKKAEEDRLAAIEAEKIERERIKIENEKLKAEAAEKERLLEIERKKQAEELAKERAKAQAEAAEKERLQSEIEAKKQSEIIAKEKEERLKKEAAKAPDKQKMNVWIDSLNIDIPDLSGGNAIATANVISEKFESFKKWAKSQIETI